MTDNEWRMIDHVSNVAMGIAWQWAAAARTQAQRLVDGCGSRQEIPDALLLVVAVRNVCRAGEMALNGLTNAAAVGQLGGALADFDAALPSVTDARNVLEHFDEYTQGVGYLQQPTVKKNDRNPDEVLALRYRIDFEHVDNDPERPVLHVGPYPIDLQAAAQAASALVPDMWAAIKTEEGTPVARATIAALTDPLD